MCLVYLISRCIDFYCRLSYLKSFLMFVAFVKHLATFGPHCLDRPSEKSDVGISDVALDWFISSPSLLCLDIPPLFCGVHQGSILNLLLYRPPLGQIKLISFIATEITHVACMSLSSLLNRCIMYYALSR